MWRYVRGAPYSSRAGPKPLGQKHRIVRDSAQWSTTNLYTFTPNTLKAVERFDTSLICASRGRRFCISTRKSTGLRLLTTQARDLICILYERSAPFILCPNLDENYISAYR
jgi:hypothetical protein